MHLGAPRAPGPLSLPRWLREALLLSTVAALVLVPSPDEEDVDPTASVLALGLLGCLVLPLRHARPRATLALTAAPAVVSVLLSAGNGASVVPLVVAVYGAALRTDRRTAIWAGGLAAAAVWLATLPSDALRWYDPESLAGSTWLALAAAVGDAQRSRRAYVQAVEERALRAERSREEEARRQVAEERLRIARELHDSVAHHISVVNVQAGVAGHLLRTAPDAAEEALGHVRRASRTVLDELSGILGVLRAPGEPAGPTEPVPGLADLGRLLASAEAGGLHVAWQTVGAPRPLAPRVDLVAYRVLQEALTNARKHGGGTAHLSVDWSGGGLAVAVRNSVPLVRPDEDGSGHGLTGMRERVASVGGRLAAGREDDGGFAVRAWLPVEEREPA